MPLRLASIPPFWRAVLVAVALVLLFQGAVEAAEWVLGPGGWHAIDDAVRAVVPALRSEGRTAVVRIVTHAGGVPATVLVGVAVALGLRRAGDAGRAQAFALALALGQAVVFAAKVFYQRPRPTDAIVAVHGFSFPSAHAFTGATLCGLAAWAVWPHLRTAGARAAVAALAVAMAVTIGASRVYLGVHYPTDVLAGWALGAAWLLAAGWALQRRTGEARADGR